jgi:hypothetical protein
VNVLHLYLNKSKNGRTKMSEVIKILPMATALSEFTKLSKLGWHIIGFKNDMVVLKFEEVKDVCR